MQTQDFVRSAGLLADDEEELVLRAQQGDERAFVRLVEELTPRIIMPIISRLVPNADDARDVQQEVYLQLYKSLPRFRGHSSLTTFVYRLVENVCKNAYHRNRRQPVRFTEMESHDGERPFLESLADASGDPQQQLERKELQQAIQEAIQAIPMKFRTVLVLADVEGKNYQEIAELTGMNQGTVKSRLNRARKQFQQNILQRRELFSGSTVLTGKSAKCKVQSAK